MYLTKYKEIFLRVCRKRDRPFLSIKRPLPPPSPVEREPEREGGDAEKNSK